MTRGEWEQLMALAAVVGLFLLASKLLAGPGEPGSVPAPKLVPQFVEG